MTNPHNCGELTVSFDGTELLSRDSSRKNEELNSPRRGSLSQESYNSSTRLFSGRPSALPRFIFPRLFGSPSTRARPQNDGQEIRAYNTEDYQYDMFLNFKDPSVEEEYMISTKRKVMYPSTLIACLLDACVYTMRMPLHPLLFSSGPITISEWCAFVPALFVFFFTAAAHVAFLFGVKQGTQIYKVARFIICDSGFENLFCLAITVPAALGLIARVVYGACPEHPDFWDTMFCNIEAESNALPQDMVMLMYLAPVNGFLFMKGASKYTIFFMWAVATGAALGCIIYLNAWIHIWCVVVPAVFTPVVAYEFERSKIAFFLQSRQMLEGEKQMRLEAEKKRQLEEEKRIAAEREKAEAERVAAERAALEAEQQRQREMALESLPVHRAVLARGALAAEVGSLDEDDLLSIEAILATIDAHIDTARLPDYDGKTAYDHALECSDCNGTDPSLRVLSRLLLSALPVDVETLEPRPASEHCFVWHRMVQQDRYEPAILNVLQQYPLLATALSRSEDIHGRQAVNIASLRCKKTILEFIYLHKRYEISTLAQPHHESATCIVHLGLDHGDGGRPVALKFMRNKDQFLREIEVRSSGSFSEEFIVGILRSYDGDEDEVFMEELCRKSLQDTRYCIVMVAGERSLADVMVKEHLQGDWGRIRSLCMSLARAVEHMHDRGFIHGDLKPLNVMRSGGRMVLIDLDASVRHKRDDETGEEPGFSGLKYSSGYIPPELVYVDPQTNVPYVRSSTRVKAKRPAWAMETGARSGEGGLNYYDEVLNILRIDDSDDSDEEVEPIRSGIATPVSGRLSKPPSVSAATLEALLDEANAVEMDTLVVDVPAAVPEDNGDYINMELVPASPAHDLWSLGVIIYQLSVNATLLLCDVDGNADETSLRDLAHWDDMYKVEKLRRIQNKYAQNLVSQLLSKDPAKRPSIKHVLAHPFLTGAHAARLGGEIPEFDVFLSYRVASDVQHCAALYEHLTMTCGLKVWWDKTSLEPGMPWDDGFCRGLVRSRVFMPVFSRGACENFGQLGVLSDCDNMLLEFRLALELCERGLVERIYPVFFGGYDPNTRAYSAYRFSGEGADHPLTCPEVVVESLERKLRLQLDAQGQGLPLVESATVAEIVRGISRYQGAIVMGSLPGFLETGLNPIVSYCVARRSREKKKRRGSTSSLASSCSNAGN